MVQKCARNVRNQAAAITAEIDRGQRISLNKYLPNLWSPPNQYLLYYAYLFAVVMFITVKSNWMDNLFVTTKLQLQSN